MPYQPEIKATNRKYVSATFPNADPYYSTIQNAIASLGSGYPTEPWSIHIYPGSYAGPVILKTNVSIIGSGIVNTVIKGNGAVASVQFPNDAGNGNCYLNNLSVDGNGQKAIVFPSVSLPNSNFIFDVDVHTSAWTEDPLPAIEINSNQVVRIYNLHCINTPVRYDEGILVSGNGQLRIHSSQIAYTNSYCIDHQSTLYSEAYHCFLVGGACARASNGVINLYVCQTVGRIETSSSAKIKHIDSFHAGAFAASDSSIIWVSGMQGSEEQGDDVYFALSGTSSKIILANSRAKVASGSNLDVVTIDSLTAQFKAMNSVIINEGDGETIIGNGTPPNIPTVFLYYCVLNKDPVNVNLADSIITTTTNAE